MPPSAVPRFRDVLNRGFPLAGRWVFLDEIVAPPDSAHGTVPVACMVYWDPTRAGWRRFTAVSDCRPLRNVPQPWQPLGELPAVDLRRRAACEAAAAGGLEAGIPDLFCRDPAYIRRHRPSSATSSEGGSSCIDERDTSPSGRSSFRERVRRGEFATRHQWLPTSWAMQAAGEPCDVDAAASSGSSARRALPIPSAAGRRGGP